MANVVEGYNGETNPCVTTQLPGFPRDLLQNSVPGTKFHRKFVDTSEDEGELELSLGLSLNGRFGLDPARENKLIRSSSIPKLVKPLKENAMACTPMPTACSLPMETHDDCRKRKEMQSLRRMEAKRKRTEKQRNMKAVNYLNKFEEERESLNGSVRSHKIDQVSKRGSDSHVMSDLGGHIKGAELKSDNENGLFCSQGSGSSGISEFDGQQIQGGSRCAEVRSPVTVQSQPDNEQRSPPNMQGDSNQSSTFAVRNALESLRNSSTEENGLVNNILVDMPCVSTKGDGPDGKKIEGFLYRYRKGEEVKIVCVCHGRFLSPAEFVKHAGGGDVSNPLKHIVVNPAPFL